MTFLMIATSKRAQKRGVRIDAKSHENRPPPKLTKTITIISLLAFALFTLVTLQGLLEVGQNLTEKVKHLYITLRNFAYP